MQIFSTLNTFTGFKLTFWLIKRQHVKICETHLIWISKIVLARDKKSVSIYMYELHMVKSGCKVIQYKDAQSVKY